jgi:FAD/FMN-containing dehydrogenase
MSDTASLTTRPSVAPGVLVLPADEHWDAARRAFNLAVDQQPYAVALPRDATDVADVVRFAARRGLSVAPQRTGHNAAPLGRLDDAVLLRTDRMRSAPLIDASARHAHVTAGAQWQDVVAAAGRVALAALHGTAPDVGVVGYTLGGGLSWYARRHGLAANRVVWIELVTADGRLARVDHAHEPELFWALRGGGGNFGVVTAMAFELLPIREVQAGALFFPWQRAGEVLTAWREWVRDVPDQTTSLARLLAFPAAPEIPEPLRGNAYAIVEAVHLGTKAEADELLAPLRELGPSTDTIATTPPEGIQGLHMDPPAPVAYTGEGRLLTDLPVEAIDRVVAAAGLGSDAPLATFEVRHTGGALARPHACHGALGTLAGSFASFGAGLILGPRSTRTVEERLEAIREVLASYDAGEYLNFTEHAVHPSRFFSPETLTRLRRVKREVDAHGLFRANHAIGPRAVRAVHQSG